jgi:UDP-glucose 4-epimerase
MGPGLTIAITGAGGFLGSQTVPWLRERGHRVLPVPRAVSSAAWQEAFAGCEVVLHLAGRAHVMRESDGDPATAYHRANVELTRTVLEAAAAAGCRTLVFASSVKAVGERSTTPWTEATPPRPLDLYGRSKLEAEALVAERGAALGLRTVSLRFPLMYGAGVRANMLQLFRAVDRGVPLPLGGLHGRRSLLYAGNAAAALEAVAQHPAAQGSYFVSDGHDLSAPELVRAIAQALGRAPRLVPVPQSVLELAGRVGDGLAPWLRLPVSSSVIGRLTDPLQVDMTRLRTDTGFTPPYSVEAGMLETARWFRATTKEHA